MYHFFIYLFILWSNRIAALFICYHSTTLCISASAICYLWKFIYLFIFVQVGRHRLLAASVSFPVAFISLGSLCCNMLTANDSEVVYCRHEHTLLLSLVSFRSTWMFRGPRTISGWQTIIANNDWAAVSLLISKFHC